MSGNNSCTVYIGNLDERVSDRVLYDILIQAGRVVDLHIPRDRDTDKPKGFAFAEYESHEIADYAVKLFSGLVVIYNRTLKFAISGQDKPSQNLPNGSSLTRNSENSHQSMRVSSSSRVSYSLDNSQVSHGCGSQSDERRVFGLNYDSNRHRSNRYDSSNPVPYSLGNHMRY